MTVQELIDILSDLDGEAEVRLAKQPSWPFEHAVGQVVKVDSGESKAEEIREEIRSGTLNEEDLAEANSELSRLKAESKPIVYIGEGSYLGYLSGEASAELGWIR